MRKNFVAKQSKMDTTLNSFPGGAGQSVPTMAPEEAGGLKRIRTFESDAHEALRSQNASLIKIAIAEDTRRQENPVIQEVETSGVGKKVAIIFISLLLLIGGAGAIYYVYTNSQKPATPIITQTLSTIIPYQKAREIDTTSATKEILTEKLNQALQNSTVSIDSVEYLYLTTTGGTGKQTLSTAGLFSLLAVTAPDEFTRSLDPQYMYGVLGLTQNAPFLILKTNFYQSGFAGMLKWEKTIAEDFKGLLTDKSSDSSTSQTTNTDDLLEKELKFSDTVIQNRDVRVLKDRYGLTRITYSFADNNTIVIAPNEKTMAGILEALAKKKFTR